MADLPERMTKAEIRAALGEQAYKDARRGAWLSDLEAMAYPVLMLVVGVVALVFGLDLLTHPHMFDSLLGVPRG